VGDFFGADDIASPELDDGVDEKATPQQKKSVILPKEALVSLGRPPVTDAETVVRREGNETGTAVAVEGRVFPPLVIPTIAEEDPVAFFGSAHPLVVEEEEEEEWPAFVQREKPLGAPPPLLPEIPMLLDDPTTKEPMDANGTETARSTTVENPLFRECKCFHCA
jgi:hypothetical protein